MEKKASIYRMVTPDHLCPWGAKARDLLKRSGYDVEDHHLESAEANEAYKREHHVDETPQIFLNGEHLGGYDKLLEHLGKSPDPKQGQTYQPVLVLYTVTFLMAISASWVIVDGFSIIRLLELFIAFSMCVLSIMKLQDLRSYATGFVQYDLIAPHFVPYAYLYAVIEGLGGVLMIAHWLTWLIAPLVLIISTIGTISVTKAVYVEKRNLNCACVGGGSSVPLGFLSLTENLLMMAMAIWMMVQQVI